MKKKLAYTGFAAAAAAAIVLNAAQVSTAAMVEERALSVEQATVADAVADHGIEARLDRADATYSVGEEVGIELDIPRAGYLTVLNISPSGGATVLYPNGFVTDSAVTAGDRIRLPGDPRARIRVTQADGPELIEILLTDRPFEVGALAEFARDGMFLRADLAQTRTLARALGVAAEHPATGVIASQTLRINTVAATGQGGITVTPVEEDDTRIALSLAADKLVYDRLEPITFTALATEPCHLALASIGTSGQAKVLFPRAGQTPPLVPADIALQLPGAGSIGRIVATGQAGKETVVAFCGTDPHEVSATARGLSDLAPVFDRGRLSQRDLDVLASSTGPSLAWASVSIVTR